MPKHSQRQVSVLLHTVQYACPLCVGVFRLPPVLTWKTEMIFCRRERGGLSPLTSHFGSRVIRCRISYRLTRPARRPLSSCASLPLERPSTLFYQRCASRSCARSLILLRFPFSFKLLVDSIQFYRHTPSLTSHVADSHVPFF